MSRKISFPSAPARASAPGSHSFQRIPVAVSMESHPLMFRCGEPADGSRQRAGSAVVLEVEAEGGEAGGVRGAALESARHNEALDEQERGGPDHEGDENPRGGRGETRQ